MTSTGERAARYYPAVLLCLGIIAAVFAMHGPSSDHMLVMPTAISGPGLHHAPGHTMDHAVRSDYPQAAESSGTGACGIAHADCVATLRPDATQLPLASSAVTMPAPAKLGDARTATLRVSRAPPRPVLDRLCISRT